MCAIEVVNCITLLRLDVILGRSVFISMATWEPVGPVVQSPIKLILG